VDLDILKFKVALSISVALGMLLFSQLHFNHAEAKGFGNYGNLEQTYGVFTMIGLAIGGFGIFFALYTRESMAAKQS
jgi:hypothetical protein